MILLIDNYDSFSYNLYQLIGSIRQDIKVIRNDELTVEEIEGLHPDAIILSPGPGKPADAGVCVDVVKELGERIPILGVCLGHQAICEAYGATVSYARKLMHGKMSMITLYDSVIFKGLPEQVEAARYHSLAVLPDTLNGTPLRVLAVADDGEVMAVCHSEYPVFGFQFHPESILTPTGKDMLTNFFTYIDKK